MRQVRDKWISSDRYDHFMGRWSSTMAVKFLRWLKVPSEKKWLDVGCGTGALCDAIEKNTKPRSISCIDPSKEFIEKAELRISMNLDLKVGEAENLPFDDQTFDLVVSGLALNFFPDIETALGEMKRVTRQNGIIAAYVWDYAGKMEFLRYFWDAAIQIDPSSRGLDEGIRFPVCNPENLSREFLKAGITNVETSFLDIETVFENFDDYWDPFLGGQGPAPGYLVSLSKELQNELKDKITKRMKFESDGSIKLTARAFAVRGINETAYIKV